MPPTRQEYLSLIQQESLGRPYITSLETAVGMVKTAAVSFEHLTNNPEWDRFLSYIQADLEGHLKERNECLRLCGETSDELARVKYQYHKGYVEALEKVMALPNELLRVYQELPK